MRHYITILTVAAALSAPAHAEETKICYPPITVQAEEVSNEIVKHVIEAEGWCDKPVPEPKEGQIVIYYERNENGECVAKVKQGK